MILLKFRFDKLKNTKVILVYLILIVGVFLRLWQFFVNRPMDRDELVMALNILKHDYSTMIKPLYGHNGDPLGYIFLLNIYSNIFGDNQFILRLPSLIFSILSLFLFKKLSEKFLSNSLAALSIFAGCNTLIWFCSSVKQYSSDLFLVLIYQLVLVEIIRNFSKRVLIIFIIITPLIFWFCYTSLFHVATAFSVLGYLWWREPKFKLLFFIYILTFLSFLLCQKFSMRELATNGEFYQYWLFGNAYPPFPLGSFDWYLNHIQLFFTHAGRFTFSLPIIIAFIFGLFNFKKTNLALLVLPFVFAFVACVFHYYPLPFFGSAKAGRFMFFLMPNFIIVLSAGLLFIYRKFTNIVTLIFISLIVLQPPVYAAHRLINPQAIDDVEGALQTISQNMQEGDILYGGKSVEWFYIYYKNKLDFKNLKTYWSDVYGAVLISSEQEQAGLRGAKRVWILIRATHKYKAVLHYFNKRGKLLSEWHFQNCDLLLYDFSDWKKQPS